MDGIGEGGNSKVESIVRRFSTLGKLKRSIGEHESGSSDSLCVQRRFCVLIVAYNRYNWNRNIQ